MKSMVFVFVIIIYLFIIFAVFILIYAVWYNSQFYWVPFVLSLIAIFFTC